ncbi:MAG: hypothetical protein COA94_03150 [Rickettsiales bacterium]|nr:MAG: hypothetical protein COA94_03150 [Rickettsiales bacterium]
MAKESEITNESNIVNITDNSNLAGRRAAIMFHRPYMETVFYEKLHLEVECKQLGITIVDTIYNDDKDAFIAYNKLRPHRKKESDESKPLILLASARNLLSSRSLLPKIILSALIELKEIDLYLYNHGFNIKNGKSELTLKPCNVKGILNMKKSASNLGLFV